MFVDYVTIKVKAGDGGNGVVSFHREKFVENGGPDGGDGGNGGSIIFEATDNVHTLLDFRFHRKFYAENGAQGDKNRQRGKSGQDIVIRVPVGTLVRERQSGAVVADMHEAGVRRVLFPGGRGGLGNARFATAVRQAPNFAKPGEKTKEFQLILELKTIADVGLVGFPNVGKSTLLSVVSAAKPKIANYHFTTLEPNLGVVQVDEDGFVMADIPGLIEGAAEGVGLGHAFLRHVERTRVLIHVIDMSGSEGRDPMEDYAVINRELARYGNLSEKPQIVAANKMDLPDAPEYLEFFRQQYPDVEIFEISALNRQGLLPLLRRVRDLLSALPVPEPFFETFVLPDSHESDGPAFEIAMDGAVYCVSGPAVTRILETANFFDDASMAYFQRSLRNAGIIDALRERGAKDGDTIRMEDLEFEFID